MSRIAPLLSVSAVFAGVLWSVEVEAREGFDLTWNGGPSECPPAATVEAEIERSLARVEAKSRVTVLAEVKPAETGEGEAEELELHVRVEHAGDVGERTIAVANCDEAVRATALFVALAVDFRPEKPAPPEDKPPPPPKPAEPSYPWLLAVGPHVASGLTPAVSGGLGVAFGYTGEWWRAEARASGFIPTDKGIAGTPAGGQYQLSSGGVVACAGVRSEPVAMFVCLGGRVARVEADGHGVSSNLSEETYLGVGIAGLDLDWHFANRLLLRAGVEGGYAPNTSRFVIENIGLAHETGRLTGEGRLELGWMF